ncbi:MAG: sigma-70 family RNA polymerase sigma factor [Anaerolineales bacterium]|nr:sigma-70 family RNA polymerase sigma factor [Anaerolineales bacterium]
MTSYSELSDQVLMQRIAKNETEALGVLYDRYGRLIYSVAYRILGSAETAEEVTLDVFHRAWERAGGYRSDRGSVRTWLAGVARNRAIDLLRRQKSRAEHLTVQWADVLAEPVATTPNPEKTTALNLQKQRIRAAISELPDTQQAVLTLAYFSGLSHREIADQTDIPLGTVKTRLRLAMQKLQLLLQDER